MDFVTGVRKFCKINLGDNIVNHGFLIKPDVDENGEIKKTLEDAVFIIACCETPDNQIDFVKIAFDHVRFEKG